MLKRWVERISHKFVLLETKGNKGLLYHLCRYILLLNQKWESKRIGNRWFWFFGRFRLPPYWWHTKTFKVITVSLVLVVLGVTGVYFLSNRRAEDIVSEIDVGNKAETSTIVDSEDPLYYIEGSLVIDDNGQVTYNFLRNDLTDAWNKNNDTVGWVCFPYCDINYPIVQGDDNSYYLSHDFYKNYSTHGWVFRDFRLTVDDTANIILYGHNLMVGGMFSNLSSVLESDEPLYVQYQTLSATYIYEVVSAYTTVPDVSYIQTSFKDDEELYTFYERVLSNNQWGKAPKVSVDDISSMLTLSTCYGDNRFVVHCRLLAWDAL